MKYVKARRNIVQPNSGFWKQLITYEGILNSRYILHTYMYRVLHCSVDSSIYSSHVNGICISTVKVSLLTIRKKW